VWIAAKPEFVEINDKNSHQHSLFRMMVLHV
jgi:hypothetical protein